MKEERRKRQGKCGGSTALGGEEAGEHCPGWGGALSWVRGALPWVRRSTALGEGSTDLGREEAFLSCMDASHCVQVMHPVPSVPQNQVGYMDECPWCKSAVSGAWPFPVCTSYPQHMQTSTVNHLSTNETPKKPRGRTFPRTLCVLQACLPGSLSWRIHVHV